MKPVNQLMIMTGNNFLVDTCIVIEIFKGNKEIADFLNNLSLFFISTIALGELYIGINRVVNKSKHTRKLNEFLKIATVLNVDIESAAIYGEIVAVLYKSGKPIPTNDVWIASIALQNNLTLITQDKHFLEINQLKTKYF